jgi:hypothetical protein
VKKFITFHKFFNKENPILEFTEETAPKWLKGDGRGSTMDNRWFWDKHVITLNIGEFVETDFQIVKRIG